MKLVVPGCGTMAIIDSDVRYVLRCPSMVRPIVTTIRPVIRSGVGTSKETVDRYQCHDF